MHLISSFAPSIMLVPADPCGTSRREENWEMDGYVQVWGPDADTFLRLYGTVTFLSTKLDSYFGSRNSGVLIDG